jgi:hypothetical protein
MTTRDDLRVDDPVDEKLYGLVEIAEQQQANAQEILKSLAIERAAFTEERELWSDGLEKLRADLNDAILEAVSASMSSAVAEAIDTVNEMALPLADHVAQAATAAEQANEAFKRMIAWASGRLLAWGLGALAGLVLLGWLASGIVLWWDTAAIAASHVRKQQLQAEVAELQATSDAWTAAGFASKLRRCGPKNRPCIAVDEAAGPFGAQSEFRLLKRS